MRPRRAALAASVLLAGCAALTPGSPRALLERADEQMAAAQYRGALALYDEFIKENPDDAATPRARASRVVVERLLLAQSEIERLRRELDSRQSELERLRREQDSRQSELERLRRDLDSRQGELGRLRREQDTRQAEIERLKADLERLRRIDLRQAPAPR